MNAKIKQSVSEQLQIEVNLCLTSLIFHDDCHLPVNNPTQQLQDILSLQHICPDVIVLKKTTGSTNDDVKALIQQGITTALVCSESQTLGRGQHQREWKSPQGNIYLSCIVNTQVPIDGRLALEAALNLMHMPCIEHLDLQIKWPNDLYSQQGKWGGILVEPIHRHQAVIGVGINVFPHTELHALDQAATSLTQLTQLHLSRVELIAEIYQALHQAQQWFNHGSQQLAARFNRLALFKDQYVTFEHIQGIHEGIFLGIQNDGTVIIAQEQQQQTFYQGRLRLISSE